MLHFIEDQLPCLWHDSVVQRYENATCVESAQNLRLLLSHSRWEYMSIVSFEKVDSWDYGHSLVSTDPLAVLVKNGQTLCSC